MKELIRTFYFVVQLSSCNGDWFCGTGAALSLIQIEAQHNQTVKLKLLF